MTNRSGERRRFMGFIRRLRAEARASDERRLLVLSGDEAATARLLPAVFEAADLNPDRVTVLADRNLEDVPATHVPLSRSAELLGTTREAVVLDCHGETRPNAIGRAAGVVDGGGLLVHMLFTLEAAVRYDVVAVVCWFLTVEYLYDAADRYVDIEEFSLFHASA
jgi:tRNA(Met) cytidine acetyltransferase